ncbi:F-box/LRR-repeat protein [Trifolium medium]|uniref:F-box/LRR-repeat protein n=1 Tax=Trifolium medium TaxID=97028 RepID=A0A392MLT7_9FABA|nr:F-box/LRR-repeat protein [Trifolium medium]
MAEMDDRISAFPDEILSHIISFLPTEDAFETRVLSKRWWPLWYFDPSPNLDYDYQRFIKNGKNYPYFKSMVYATIFIRSEHQPIKSFRLRCDDNVIYQKVAMTWLTEAAEKGMEYLDVHLCDMKIHNCVLSVFSFRNLVVIKLKDVRVNVYSSAVDLPLLRILHLNKVYFVVTLDFLKVLDGCPILEDFKAKNMYILFSTNVYYDEEFKGLTNLVRADIDRLSDFDVPLRAFHNVEFLRLEKMYGMSPVFSNLTELEFVVGGCIVIESLSLPSYN